MKWLCEVERVNEWKGFVLDDFGKERTSQTWEEHIVQVNIIRQRIKSYAEFPPVVSADIAKPRVYIPNDATDPLISDKKEFEKLCGRENINELIDYHHICYVELHN